MTDKAAKAKLNRYYSKSLSWEDAYEQLVYLTNKNRGKHTTKYKLLKAYQNNTLGNILARLDPIAFYCAKNDMR